LDRLVEQFGDLFRAGFVIQLFGQLTGRPQIDVQLLDHMDRQADRPSLVHNRPFDGLTNTPSRIGGESEAPLWIKLRYYSNQAKVSFFDQVQQGQAPVDITT